jgi:hypothetical protein
MLAGALVCSIFAIESLIFGLESIVRVYNSRNRNSEDDHADQSNGTST